MCGGGNLLKSIASIALPVVGSIFGGPLGGALGGGLGSALGGGSIGQDLLGAATGGLGAGLSGATGSLIPADSLFGGINSGITGALSPIGSAISGGLSDIGNSISSGVSNAGDTLGSAFGFGGNPAYSDPSISGQFAQGLGSGSATEFAPSGAGGAAGTLGAGFSPSITGAGSQGGGSAGGFFQGLDSGSLASGNSGIFSPTLGAVDNASASGAVGGTGNVLSQPSAYNAFNANGAGNAFGNAASQTIGQPMDFTTSGGGGGLLQSLLGGNSGGGNMLNGLLRGGLSSLFNQNPYQGYPQIANTLNQSAQQYNPYIQQGQAANTAIGNLEGLNGQAAAQSSAQNWQNTPGYQFQLQQGLGALQNSAAAQGGLLSGNTAQALQNYGQGLANTTYNQYLGNLQNQAGQGLGAIGPQSQLQGQAAALNQMPKQYQAGQNNQGLGGLFGSLFPQQGLGLNPQAGGGYNLSQGGGGLLSMLGF